MIEQELYRYKDNTKSFRAEDFSRKDSLGREGSLPRQEFRPYWSKWSWILLNNREVHWIALTNWFTVTGQQKTILNYSHVKHGRQLYMKDGGTAASMRPEAYQCLCQ